MALLHQLQTTGTSVDVTQINKLKTYWGPNKCALFVFCRKQKSKVCNDIK